ncbi:MAG: hypothetical protein A2285_10825 [Elusimicrobia bacterium RIFOXYA12_FULL_57_11]|nr:MAG: hypothetical protein A2285_10825 [Elusimicrobia bacterium RIFOXYA12_FULL_57_11]
MKKAFEVLAVCLLLASGAAALEITGTTPAAVKGLENGDFNLSGIVVKDIGYKTGGVIMPVTENNGKTYVDVKLLSKDLYAKLETCFRFGCAKPAAKIPAPVLKLEGLRPLRSKTRVANAEMSFDGELTVVLGVMASLKEPGTFWLAFPDSVELKSKSLKAEVEKIVKAAWAKNKK